MALPKKVTFERTDPGTPQPVKAERAQGDFPTKVSFTRSD